MDKIIEFRKKAQKYPELFKVVQLIHPKTKEIIESFHIQEGAFKKRNLIPFGARGCLVLPKSNKIISRGYDKFFNINEVEETQWGFIESRTVGPYELTLKENGCIIFVSEYNDDLLVASKHSFTKINYEGKLQVNEYASFGEKYLNECLGDKREQFIQFIKKNNVTLVFELVDNDFEEHVLEYSKMENGLYFHGINNNSVEFKTWSSEEINKVAKEFNLKQVEYKIYNNIKELREFMENCNGFYKGKAIEGWVIRCKKDNGDNFLFKYKYNEPYLLYREWREATKAYVKNKPMKYKFMKTYNYMKWIKQKYQTNRELFVHITQRKGFIKLRNLYLEESNGGQITIPSHINSISKEACKYKLILPISIIGFGKTTVGKMLNNLYNIGHIQENNDNQKGEPVKFIDKICKSFNSNNIVMPDKNYHIKMHRNKFCEKLRSVCKDSLWIVALHWNIESVPEDEVIEFFQDRKGKNHQNFKPENSSRIIREFLKKYQSPNKNDPEDSIIDEVIEINFKEDSVSVVKKVIKALNLEPKTDEELQDAFRKAIEIEIKK